MEQLKSLEEKFARVYKNAPKLGENAIKTLVQYAPWLALAGGILQTLSVWWLYNVSRDYDRAVDVINSLTAAVGGTSPVEKLNMFYWLSFVVLIISAVLSFAAYSGLKDRKKSGWNLLFVGVLVNFAYGVVSILDNSSRGGFGSFIGSLIVVAFALYILFQIRSHYGAHGGHKLEHKQPE